jgi:hypothetical protein
MSGGGAIASVLNPITAPFALAANLLKKPNVPSLVQPAAAEAAPPPTDYSVKTRSGGAAQAAAGLGYVGLGNAVDTLGKSTKRNTYATQDLLG